ncbi:MAG: ATP-binding protein [Candidatus Auribacterota bacterium]
MKNDSSHISNVPFGVISFSAGKDIVQVDPSVLHMIGFTDHPYSWYAGKKTTVLTPLTSIIDNITSQLAKNSFVRAVTDVITLADGTVKTIHADAYLVQEKSGASRTIKALFFEAEDQKTTESELIEEINSLKKLNSELEQFVRSVCHDIKGPLSTIEQFSLLLEKEAVSGNTKDLPFYTDRIKQIAKRVRSFVDSLKGYYYISKEKPSFVKIELNQVCQKVMESLQPLIKETGANIEVKSLDIIETDYSMISQLFYHLISNAITYREDGQRPEVKVSTQVSGDNLIITVADKGIGFEDKFASRIFEPLQRLHPRDRYDGHGLGLAICSKIVEIHHGKISTESQPGQGSRFIVSLPLSQSRTEQPGQPFFSI